MEVMRSRITVKRKENMRQQKKEDKKVEEIKMVYMWLCVICIRQAEWLVQIQKDRRRRGRGVCELMLLWSKQIVKKRKKRMEFKDRERGEILNISELEKTGQDAETCHL